MLSLLAASLLSQCATGITDNAQDLCGQKTFPQGIRPAWIATSSVEPGVYGGTLTLMGEKTPSDPGPDLTFESYHDRDAGTLVLFRSGGEPVAWVDHNGVVYAGYGRRTPGASFIGGNGYSGQPTLSCVTDTNCIIRGQLRDRYWGHHGAVEIDNGTTMMAGFPFAILNSQWGGGDQRDKLLLITHQGGWATQANIQSDSNDARSRLSWCDGNDVNPSSEGSNRYGQCAVGTPWPDGGPCVDWYLATDAGHAMDGTIMPWVADVREPCQCDSRLFDGGRTSSWRKLSDRSECKP